MAWSELKISPKIVGPVAVGVGVLLLCLGARQTLMGHASLKWPSVEGRVVSSSVSTHHNSHARRGFLNSLTSTRYEPHVTYEYEVGGQTYRGNTMAFYDMEKISRHDADEIAERYAPETVVRVHYSPSAPDDSVLEPGLSIRQLKKPVVGVLFLVLGIIGTVQAFRKREGSAG